MLCYGKMSWFCAFTDIDNRTFFFFFPLPKNAGEMPAPQSAISSLRAKQLLITSGCVSI